MTFRIMKYATRAIAMSPNTPIAMFAVASDSLPAPGIGTAEMCGLAVPQVLSDSNQQLPTRLITIDCSDLIPQRV